MAQRRLRSWQRRSLFSGWCDGERVAHVCGDVSLDVSGADRLASGSESAAGAAPRCCWQLTAVTRLRCVLSLGVSLRARGLGVLARDTEAAAMCRYGDIIHPVDTGHVLSGADMPRPVALICPGLVQGVRAPAFQILNCIQHTRNKGTEA